MMLPGDVHVLESLAAELRRDVAADLAADEMGEASSCIAFEADFRFARQQFELPLPCRDGFGPDAQQALMRDFQQEYQRRYGSGALMLGAPVELVSLRAIGRAETLRAELTESPAGADTPALVSAKRTIYVGAKGGVEPLAVDVVSATDLKPGSVCTGPMLVDGIDTTIWIPPRARARVDTHRTMDMEILA
jgi:N-methylhydantoinase A